MWKTFVILDWPLLALSIVDLNNDFLAFDGKKLKDFKLTLILQFKPT